MSFSLKIFHGLKIVSWVLARSSPIVEFFFRRQSFTNLENPQGQLKNFTDSLSDIFYPITNRSCRDSLPFYKGKVARLTYHEDENVILSILFKYLSILDMLSTTFLFAQNGDTKSKTKTLNSLKVTKLIFAFYFFPLARILSACSEIYY